MYVVVNRITVAPADADDFAAGFAEAMAHLEGVPGLRRSTLLAPATPGAPFMSTMEFDSHEDFTAWRDSDSFQRAHAPGHVSAVLTESATETYDLHTEI